MMITFQSKKWDLAITRNCSFFHSCMAAEGAVKKNTVFGVAPKDEINIITKSLRLSIFTEEKNLDLYEKSIEKVCLNPKSLRRLQEVYNKKIQDLFKTSKALEENPTEKNYDAFIRSYVTLTSGLFITAILGRHMAKILKSGLHDMFPNFSNAEIEKKMAVLTYPEFRTPLTSSQLELLQLGALMQKKKVLLKDLPSSALYKNLIRIESSYKFIPVNYTEDPWTEQQMMSQLGDMLKKDCMAELESLNKSHKQKVKAMKLELGDIPNAELRQVARSLQIGTLLNEKRKFAFCRAGLAYRPLFVSISQKYKLDSWKEVWQLTPEEVKRLAFHNAGSVLKNISKRTIAVVVTDRKLGYRVLTTKEAQKVLAQVKPTKTEKTKITKDQEVIGTIASKGFAKGTARIVLNSKDFPKFKTGDILITAMTSVDFVPLMKRAAAFVTNEGGLTSHASIVSRELDKPCIIGTKIATQVFKDGDMVEVDANKGIVRKI